MARKMPARDVIVKLIVGAGQASPSPPVGPALGSKGVKSMDFCKEFNARTAHLTAGTPIPARVTVRPDRSFTFDIRTPTTAWLLLQAAGVKETKGKLKGAQKPGTDSVGTVTLKHIYEIAKIKKSEPRLVGLSLEGLCKSVIAQAGSIGVKVVPPWAWSEPSSPRAGANNCNRDRFFGPRRTDIGASTASYRPTVFESTESAYHFWGHILKTGLKLAIKKGPDDTE